MSGASMTCLRHFHRAAELHRQAMLSSNVSRADQLKSLCAESGKRFQIQTLLYIYCIFMFVCVFFCASSSSMSISYTENIVRRRFGFCLLSHRFTLLTSEISFQHCRSRLKKRQFDCLKYSIGFDSLSCTCSQCQCQPQKNKQPRQARTGRRSWYVVHTKRESDRSVQSAYKLILQCPHGSLSYVSKCNEGIDSKRGCATPSEGFLVGIVQCKCNGKMSYSE